ncbi:MAG: PRC-barrel domain-containing protein [Anaerolineae bacterium]|jgi:sporulation protein YlmC with PRC-barrel domain
MRLGKSLIGNPVFRITDGRKLGEVKDLYLDDDLTTVVGLFLGREGLLRPTPLFVERADIHLFGIDTVLATTTAVIREGGAAPEPPGWLRLDELRGREVHTPGGTRIGKIADVALDEAAQVTGFSLANLSVKGPVAEAAAVGRVAVEEATSADEAMTIDLSIAEQTPLVIDLDLLFPESPAGEPPCGAPVEEASDSEQPATFGQEGDQLPQSP